MPVSKYDRYFGGKSGSAQKTLSSMQSEYGQKKGTSVFYALKNKRKSQGLKHHLKRRMRRGGNR
jgi:hypothetical protein